MSAAPLPKTIVPPRTTPRPALTRRPPAPPPPTPVTAPAAVGRMVRLKAVVEAPLALALLAAAVPVILLALVAVKLTSRGPGMYTQSRVGRGGRVFTMFKIRTMYHECESLTGPRWSMPGDPRITPVGKVLRALHIDELPQLANVIRGDMSLVGPRPERPEICKELRRAIAGYDRRHAVKPGITGFAQIHLPPDSNLQSVRNKVAYDRFYILRMGLRTEAYIYFCTALKLFGLRSLYQRPPLRPTEDE